MGFGLIIIGDEILSGRRRDRHMAHAIRALRRRGLELAWSLVVGDDPGRLEATLRRTLTGIDAVFCYGGIGATPDDHTRACAARAASVPLERHPEAVAQLEALFGAAAYPTRIRMAELPAGASLIPNPVGGVPGFTLGDHHFLPGFPKMAGRMMSWVLDQRYADLQAPGWTVEAIVTVHDTPESELVALMESFAEHHPAVKLASLPRTQGGRRRIEFVLRGPRTEVAAARGWLTHQLTVFGCHWTGT